MNSILNESSVLEENEFIKPEIDEVNYLLDQDNNDCRNKFFSYI